eukprot:COSAG01_NODE_1612_length_9735_cov_74.461810_4_plen_91_part_00
MAGWLAGGLGAILLDLLCLPAFPVFTSVGPADLQTVFDPKAAMAAFEILRLQPPRGAQLVHWEEQFRVRRSFQNSIDFGKATASPTGSKT